MHVNPDFAEVVQKSETYFQLCPYFSRTPMTLNIGMRPTSTWVLCLSHLFSRYNVSFCLLINTSVPFIAPIFLFILCFLLCSQRGITCCKDIVTFKSSDFLEKGIGWPQFIVLWTYWLLLLYMKLRWFFRWFPFMSVQSCSRRMIDAILKEKCICFMPNYVSLVPMIKGWDSARITVSFLLRFTVIKSIPFRLLSVNAARSLREYLGIDYTPASGAMFSHKRASSSSEEYFSSPHVLWWLLVSVLLLLIVSISHISADTL